MADVESLARAAAQKAWQEPRHELPPTLAKLDYDQVRDIRFKTDQSTWREQALPFEAQYFHLGLYQKAPVQIHEILPDGSVQHIAYSHRLFDYGKNIVKPGQWGDLGFAGFRLHYPLNNPAYKDELVVFQGASYFRALGAGQQYGLSARGLAIDTVGGQGEEFPRFTQFWLQRPADATTKSVKLLALMESSRVTGAYEFTIEPGEQTVTRVDARIFVRQGADPVHTMGVAPLTSMFFFGENQPRPGDFRPEVHDSDGLMMATGDGEWLWRPLQNPRQITVSSFAMRNPQGFGLMQRDRHAYNYEDIEARYERRPSAWVRPVGQWGDGRVELVQLPTPDETHDNIVAYWVPAQLPAPGEPLRLQYDLLWQSDADQRPPSAWTVQSRIGFGYTRLSEAEQREQIHYVIDFAGPALSKLERDAKVSLVATADANGEVLEAIAYPHSQPGMWRASLRVRRLDAARPIELRAFLQHENDTVSETWTQLQLPE
ncbi:glucan biosynthesis protein G [Hydrogenophaga sp. 5NK40-0174]|uniref:glucan biosynthesis protein G n=1 Tax=Hydrogenophaga sp. 5NK40-0174 TaxID=3127649 RepID=UPI003107323C